MRVLAITQCFPPRRSTFSSRSACLTTHLAERRDSMQVVAFLSSSRQLGNLRHEVLEQYRWADTVLIMLRDWATMRETVPSRPYEALLTGCHISASVAGETADLVSRFGAGDVVPPQDPDALAALWAQLAPDRDRLHVPLGGRHWVRKQLTPEALSHAFEDVLVEVVHG